MKFKREPLLELLGPNYVGRAYEITVDECDRKFRRQPNRKCSIALSYLQAL